MHRLGPASARTARAFVLAVLTTLSGRGLSAQATVDPVTATRALFGAGEPASRAALDLKNTHRQTTAQATATMKSAGYDAVAIAGALRTTYSATGNQAYDALSNAGFSAHATGAALQQAGLPVGMDCVDQQNNVVPCGTFGGMTNTAVMGQVSWTPKVQGYTDSLLTITGTNIPAVTIRIGSTSLTAVSATSSQVVVRLPAAATKGSLTMRRNSDGVEGTMETMYNVVAWVVTIDWSALGTAALTGAISDARRWLSGAKITPGKCVVAGPLVNGPATAISTSSDFSGQVKQALLAAGAQTTVAANWDAAFSAAWHAWANNLSIPALPLFPPAFAFWPAASAPATASIATPIGLFLSTGTLGMTPMALTSTIQFALGAEASSTAAQTAVATFASAFSLRFTQFMASGLVAGVIGSGTVPVYDPPKVSAGPVSGTCTGTGIVSNWSSF